VKKLPILMSCLLLAACEATTFEHPPVAALPCDPALAGHWASEGEGDDKDGEIVLQIDAACQLAVVEHKADGPSTGDPTTLHLGRHGRHAYAWVDAGWMMRRFDEDHRFPDGDVFLMRYRQQGGRLELWSTDDKLIAHAIIDDKLEGEVLARDNELFNRLTGRQDPEVLEHRGLFDAEAAAFRRMDPEKQ
jgi:hypothetical protein